MTYLACWICYADFARDNRLAMGCHISRWSGTSFRKVEARLHCMLDGMTDAYYVKLYADEERRARVIAMDVLFRLA